MEFNLVIDTVYKIIEYLT